MHQENSIVNNKSTSFRDHSICKKCRFNDKSVSLPVNSALGSPWIQIINAVSNLYLAKTNQTISFWTSFMLQGNIVNDGNGDVVCQTIQGTNPTISHSAFIQNIDFSLQQWKEVFETLFNNLTPYTFTLNFTHRSATGDETGISVPSRVSDPSYSLISGPGASNLVGDLRFSMIPIDGPFNVLAYTYSPGGIPQVQGSVGSDFRLDSQEQWRLEGGNAGSVNIPKTIVHEAGHSLGAAHDSSQSSIMFPTIQNGTQDFLAQFPGGLKGSLPDLFTMNQLYGGTTTVVGVNSAGQVWQRTGFAPFQSLGTSWTNISVSPIFTRVSCGPDGSIWGLNTSGVFRRAGVSISNPAGTSWVLVDSSIIMTELAVGVYGMVYALDAKNNIYYRAGVVPGTTGTSWAQITGALSKISAGTKGQIWGTNPQGQVWYRSGITATNPAGTQWFNVSVSPLLSEISTGYLNDVWAISTTGSIYFRSGISSSQPLGTAWTLIPSNSAIKISVGPSGFVYYVDASNNIFSRDNVAGENLQGTGWTQITGALQLSISAGFLR